MITFATPQTKTHLLSFLTQQRWFLLTGDVLVISLAHMLSAWIRLGERINVFQDYTGAYIFALALYPLALYVFDLYNMQRAFLLGQSALRMTAAVLLGGTLSTMCFYLVPEWQYGRGALAIQMVLMWIFLIGWRITYGTAFQAARAKKKALVLGAGESAKALYKLLATPLSPYEVTGFLDDDPGEQGTILGSPAILGTLEQFGDIARETGSKVAIVAIPHNRPYWLNRRILEARLQGMEVFEMPTVYERLTGRVPAHYIEDQWLLFSDGFYLLSKEYVQKIKRLSDFAVAGLLLLMTSPLILLTAMAIRLESRGPVFYQQERVGKNSRVFKVYKFRSMRIDAESQGARWAQKGDPRVTLVGRWIRPFRIDELPQIWNIFTGDMSLVGPRPERPEFVKDLEYKIPYYGIRHSVRPGITGWAQVKYPYGASVEDALRKLEYDLYYIKNMSIVLDLKILLRTVGVVLLGEGAR